MSIAPDAVLGGGQRPQRLRQQRPLRRRRLRRHHHSPTATRITLSFDVRLTGTIPASDRGFRFGLYNDGDIAHRRATPAAPTCSDDDLGYVVRLDTGTPQPPPSPRSPATPPAPSSAAPSTASAPAATTLAYGLSTTAAHTAVFTISRSGDTQNFSFLLDGLAPFTGSSPTTFSDAGFTTNTFNEFAIGSNVNGLNFNIDNVVVSTTAVPEPASLALLATGAGGLMLRRRRH